MQALAVARNCFAVDFYFNSSLLFYADDRANAIGQVSRVGTAKKNIINSGLRRPQGLAVDWVAGNLFWTDSGNDVIEVCEAHFWYLIPAKNGREINPQRRRRMKTENLKPMQSFFVVPQVKQ